MGLAFVPTETVWVDEVPGDPSTRLTNIGANDLNNFKDGLLSTNNDLVVLFWNGTTYLPRTGSTTAKADTSKARLFVGPVDPSTVAGVVLAEADLWDQYT